MSSLYSEAKPDNAGHSVLALTTSHSLVSAPETFLPDMRRSSARYVQQTVHRQHTLDRSGQALPRNSVHQLEHARTFWSCCI